MEVLPLTPDRDLFGDDKFINPPETLLVFRKRDEFFLQGQSSGKRSRCAAIG
jgi:hypothetical protein